MKKRSLVFLLVGMMSAFALSQEPLNKSNAEKSLVMPMVTTVSVLSLGFAVWTQINPRLSLFEDISFERYAKNVSKPPRWDHDRLEINFYGHPAWGAETYLLSRNQGFDWFVSFLFSAGASVLWEYGFEAFAERPSFQDLILTPVLGSVLGEVRYRLKEHLLFMNRFDPSWFSDLLIVLLDPVNALVRLFKSPLFPPRSDLNVRVSMNPDLSSERIKFEPKLQIDYQF
jgi:hypothetical protein